jgi:TetR/AcrR family transcriptional repressor of mexJK operon
MAANNVTSKLNESKREQIINGARQVFLENGYAATSMERVAKTAGVSKGTLYNYFENKETLFVTLIQGECCKIEDHAQSDADYSNAPPEPILSAIGQQWLMGLLNPDQRALFRSVLAEAMQFPELGRAIEACGPAIAREKLSQYLSFLNEHQLLRIENPQLAAEQFFALCDAGIVRRMQLSVQEPTAEQVTLQVSSAVKLFLRGYQL